jgi:hypothetical protein
MMAIYEIPDELSLMVAEQQFPDKFLTPKPTTTRGRLMIHYSIVCVPKVRHARFLGTLNAAMDDERGLYLMDKPNELSHLRPRDMADQLCVVCSRTVGEIEEKGCGYDKKKHG